MTQSKNRNKDTKHVRNTGRSTRREFDILDSWEHKRIARRSIVFWCRDGVQDGLWANPSASLVQFVTLIPADL